METSRETLTDFSEPQVSHPGNVLKLEFIVFLLQISNLMFRNTCQDYHTAQKNLRDFAIPGLP